MVIEGSVAAMIEAYDDMINRTNLSIEQRAASSYGAQSSDGGPKGGMSGESSRLWQTGCPASVIRHPFGHS